MTRSGSLGALVLLVALAWAATATAQTTVTFDAPPNALQAMNAGNYNVSGLTLSGPITLASPNTAPNSPW